MQFSKYLLQALGQPSDKLKLEFKIIVIFPVTKFIVLALNIIPLACPHQIHLQHLKNQIRNHTKYL